MKSLPALLQGSRRRPLLLLAGAGLLRGALSFGLVLLLSRVGGAAVPAPWLAAGLLLVAALLGLLRGVETVQAERLGQAYVRALRRRLFETLLAAGPEGQRGYSRGSLWLRLTGDLNGLRRWISQGLARVVAAVPLLLTLVASLLWLQPLLAGLVAPAVVLTAGLALLQRKALVARETEVRRARARLAGPVEGLLRDTAGEGASERLSRLKRRSRDVADASVARAAVHARVRALAEFAPHAITAAAALLLGGAHPASLLPALALAGLVGAPLRDLTLAWEMRQGYRVARTQVLHLLQLTPVNDPAAADPAALHDPDLRLSAHPA